MAKTSSSTKKPTAPRKKAAAKKTTTAPITRKPTAAKKTVAKPAAKPKTVKKTTTAKKPSSSKKPTVKKATAAKPAARPKDTVKTLREQVDAIEARLKLANTNSQKNVRSLQTAFEVMEKKWLGQQFVDQKAFDAKVSKLSARLTRTVEQTRNDIAQDLKSALSSQDLGEISNAVARAKVRLDEAELTQAEALTRVNRHIADLAKAIDERMREEHARHQQSLRDLNDKADTHHATLTLRMNKIEEASADAIRKLGDQIVTLNMDMQKRVDENSDSIRDKLTDIGRNTQTSVEDLRRKLERRIESIEEAQNNLDSYADRMITTISTRLDSLEYGLVAASPAAATAHTGPVDTQTVAQAEPVEVPYTPQVMEPAPAPVIAMPQAAPVQAAQAVAPAYAPTGTAEESFGPVEYVPEPYVPPAALPQTEPYEPNPQAFTTPHTITPESPPITPAYATAVPAAEYAQPANPYDSTQITDDDLPYENPAYAETTPQKRPGRFPVSLSGDQKIFGLTPRNLKVAGLAIAVLGLGYFGTKTFLGGEPGASNNSGAIQQVTTDVPASDGLIQPVAPEIETTPALGEYEDNRGAVSESLSETPLTLETAAEAGDPIAQFQLGISHLDAGQIEEGVANIRAAANQNQPAAQYRLAKIYETGQGVTADPDMARQLTERAARNGNRIAMHDLALYYAEGRGGVDTDILSAASWFEKAAERGVVDSQFNLGVLFESGQGVPQNLTDAYVWYSIAAGQGDQFARERRDLIKGQIAEADLTRADERIAAFTPTKIDEAANGIFRDVPWTVSDNDAPDTAPELVKSAQELLVSLGYDAGTPDGAMGPKTRTAIIEFQRSVGLIETGEVTSALIDRLEIASGA